MTRTLTYYNQNAQTFISHTQTVNLQDTQERFLSCLPPGSRILDFGCGSGRDTRYFLQQGYSVDAIDGSEELCRLASQFTGIPVRQMLFQGLDCRDTYDGIWACAYDEGPFLLLQILLLAQVSSLPANASKTEIKNAIRRHNQELKSFKEQLTNMVPYRAWRDSSTAAARPSTGAAKCSWWNT